MGTFYILGAVQSLFFALLLVFRKETKKADRYLMFFFLIMTLFLLFAYSNTIQLFLTHPEIMPIIVLVPLLYGPVLYFYVSELNAEHHKKKKLWYHFIPIAAYYLIMSPLFLKENHDDLIGFFNEKFIDLPLYINLGVAIQYLSAPTYFIFILIKLSKHKKSIKNAYSNDEYVNLNWLNYMVIGAIVLWLLETAMIVYWNYFAQSVPVFVPHMIKSSYVVFIFLMGFYGLRQGNIFTKHDDALTNYKEDSECLKLETQQLKKRNLQFEKCWEENKEKLLVYISEKKPYLNSNLKLLDIAIDLDIPPHVLSNLINEKLNQNYFDFINTYRVDDAKAMLINPTFNNYTILSIAFECGFNSKSSFNRIFKNQTGFTPSIYQKSSRYDK